MRYENGLDQVVLEQWDERQIAHFEEIGERLIGNLEEKKKDIKKQIARENLREIERKAHYELEEDEYIELQFQASATGGYYLGSLLCSADYFAMPLVLVDVGNRFVVFGTKHKVMIYEVKEMYQLQREYIIDYNNISKYYYKTKKDRTILCFKAKKDKYNQLRECSNWLLYGYLQGRINMMIDRSDRDVIAKFFDRYCQIDY
ncbi:hypothetical protein ACRS6Y_04015 [Bacillus cytotoxicus]|uniref:Uncharacterized protein n=1 Tax=Bacillus cytotoxicus (strain DSM 22905 / CIP 110041 / 391-98 / NVH 391-98) TaxID=315749 RepID=A7GVJ3_BACCN|nr:MULTISPECIES: hypothetical protein [Bacillus cereus group]ABS24151.1 hypothetical protein Bcer98_3969 [Bacillus cytotoxicus NVH 391-98]AWC30715.1 hypothetical protein CG483_021820 [Bacillus cytotoxicus]AWC34773.1 hypothetical protein CG482_021875 [Bacillus cytotoxicus]AWC38769.1 hypothetical protein CG481_021710 [Bacillus cytotoxicus]AWC42857.1 hypothetical protein CG480_021840 [Bacillus cytotoxicus]